MSSAVVAPVPRYNHCNSRHTPRGSLLQGGGTLPVLNFRHATTVRRQSNVLFAARGLVSGRYCDAAQATAPASFGADKVSVFDRHHAFSGCFSNGNEAAAGSCHTRSKWHGADAKNATVKASLPFSDGNFTARGTIASHERGPSTFFALDFEHVADAARSRRSGSCDERRP